MIASINFCALAVRIRYCLPAITVFRSFLNIQKDAYERKLAQAGRTNVAIYTCTKFAIRIVYVDTNNSVRSWKILYVNHVLVVLFISAKHVLVSKYVLVYIKVMECTRFGLQGGNYITKKKVRVVSLACDMPTGPPLNLYQLLSYYLKQYGSYGLYKISASGETTT